MVSAELFAACEAGESNERQILPRCSGRRFGRCGTQFINPALGSERWKSQATSQNMIQTFKPRLFALINKTYRLRIRLWTRLYAPFLGELGRGTLIEKVSFLRNPDRLFLGRNVWIAHNARIEAFTHHGGEVYSPVIIIGDGTTIEPYAHIGAAESVTIGQNVLIASGLYITDHDHVYADPTRPIALQPLQTSPVSIGDNVWLGENVTVLKGVTIGRCAILGAGSVVTHDIPPYAVAAGVPARVLRIRPGVESPKL